MLLGTLGTLGTSLLQSLLIDKGSIRATIFNAASFFNKIQNTKVLSKRCAAKFEEQT